MKKTREEFTNYMWEIYPEENQYSERGAMLKAYDFLSGQYDFEQKEREEIRKKIEEVMKKMVIKMKIQKIYVPVNGATATERIDTAVWKYNGINSETPKEFLSGVEEQEKFIFSEKELRGLIALVANDVRTKGFGGASVPTVFADMWLMDKIEK